MVYPWMLDDRFNAAFPNYRGMSLATPPVRPAPAPPPVVEEPYRDVPPEAMDAWRRNTPIAPLPAAPPAAPPAPSPRAATPFPPVPASAMSDNPVPVAAPSRVNSVPYILPTDVPGQQGVTISSNPLEAPTMANQIPGFSSDVNSNYQKALAGLSEIAKGVKPKSGDSSLNQITPVSSYGGNTGSGGAQGAQLLAALLTNARKNYGTKITGY